MVWLAVFLVEDGLVVLPLAQNYHECKYIKFSMKKQVRRCKYIVNVEDLTLNVEIQKSPPLEGGDLSVF